MKNFQFAKRLWIPFLVAALVLSVFYFYFYAYVPQNEVELTASKFRSLETLSQNIKNAKLNSLQRFIYSLNTLSSKLTRFYIGGKNIPNGPDSMRTTIRKFDSVETVFARNVFPSTLKEDSRRVASYPDSVHISVLAEENEQMIALTYILAGNKEIDFGYEQIDLYSQSIALEEFIKSDEIRLQKDFEEFVIIRQVKTAGPDGSDKRSGKPTNVEKIKTGISHQSFSNELRIKNLDSLFIKDPLFLSGRVRDMTINNENYKLFSHRMAFGPGEDWILCGLTRSSTFTHETRRVDIFVGLFAAFLLISLFLLMPVLKLLVMSNIERLQISNVLSAGLSAVIGGAVICLLLLFIGNTLGGLQERDIRLSRLAKSINNSLTEELASVTLQLERLEIWQRNLFRYKEDVPARSKSFQGLIMESGKPHKGAFKELWSTQWSVPDLNVLSKHPIITYPWFQEAIWINGAGAETLFIASHPVDPVETPPNLYNRTYFRDAYLDTGNLWPSPAKVGVHKKFALQSIRSWRDGKNQAGISIPITTRNVPATGENSVEKYWKPKVLAISTRLGSIMNPLLPPGYAFCVVDTVGNVLFHSDTRRNNQEKLFDEISDPRLVKSAILGRDSIALSFKYEGREKRGMVLPVQNIPLTLVVFHDDEYYHMPISLTVGQASIITFVMLLILAIDVGLLFVTTFRTTKLKTRRFFLSWLRPKMDGQEVQMDDVNLNKPSINYIRSILFLCTLLLFVGIMSCCTNSRWVGVCLLTLPVFALVFHFVLYRREYLLFNLSSNHRKKFLHKPALHPFVVTSAGLVIVIDLYGSRFIEAGTWPLVLLVQLCWLILAFVCSRAIPNGILTRFIPFKFPGSYFLSITLWLLLVSIALPFYFYKNAYYKENTIWNRYSLLAAARNYDYREAQLPAGKNVNPCGNYLAADGTIRIDKQRTTISNFKTPVKKRDASVLPPEKNTSYDELLFKADPLFGALLDEAREAIFPGPSDGQWQWNSVNKKTILSFTSFSGARLILSSPQPAMGLRGEYIPLMFFLSAIALGLIILLIRFLVKHIFGIGLVSEIPPTSPAIKWQGEGRVFIVGAPYSGKTQLIINTMNLPKEARVDLRKPPYVVPGASSIVIEHFEYGINNHAVNEQKRELFMAILQKPDTKDVTVTSTVQPSALFDFYESMLVNTDKEKEKSEFREYKQTIRYWKNVLGGFATGYHSLELAPVAPPQSSGRSAYVDWYLRSELHHGYFLPKLENKIDIPLEYTYETKEEMILQVEDAAQNYYQSLWNSFSNSEKFLLFDLAKDHFANFRNNDAIRALLQKGVLTMRDSLRIMNRSFSNFILSVVKEDEAMKMDQELRRNGTWHSVQLGIIIVLLGLATFIAIAHQGMLSGLNAWATAITSGVALLTRFGGIFGGKTKE